MGGAVVVLVAARRPDLVRTLTLISPAVPDNRIRAFPLRNDPRTALPGDSRRSANSRCASSIASTPPEQRVAGTIALCFADPSPLPGGAAPRGGRGARARLKMPWADTAFLRSMRGLGAAQFLQGAGGWATMRRIRRRRW